MANIFPMYTGDTCCACYGQRPCSCTDCPTGKPSCIELEFPGYDVEMPRYIDVTFGINVVGDNAIDTYVTIRATRDPLEAPTMLDTTSEVGPCVYLGQDCVDYGGLPYYFEVTVWYDDLAVDAGAGTGLCSNNYHENSCDHWRMKAEFNSADDCNDPNGGSPLFFLGSRVYVTADYDISPGVAFGDRWTQEGDCNAPGLETFYITNIVSIAYA